MYGVLITPMLSATCSARQVLAVVPDCNRPFTITMHNPTDGLDYVVAHYEPHALQHATLSSSSSSMCSTGGPAANLCDVFNSRKGYLLMQRTSAADELAPGQDPGSLVMAMAGSRNTKHGNGPNAHLSRYHNDLGECMHTM
jgi:hypothetical protein